MNAAMGGKVRCSTSVERTAVEPNQDTHGQEQFPCQQAKPQSDYSIVVDNDVAPLKERVAPERAGQHGR